MDFITGGCDVALPAKPFRGRMLIDGAWVEAADGERIIRESPGHAVAVSSYPAAKPPTWIAQFPWHATLSMGGEPISGVAGLFMQPTVLTGVTREMRVAREEIFGPVLSVLTFETAEEALAIANETLYGLSAAVWSRNIDICLTAARRIKAGTIWINSFMDGYPELPFGGYRDSGIGRELGRMALENYTETKTVQMHVGPRTGWWLPG